MKKLVIILILVLGGIQVFAQGRKAAARQPVATALPELSESILQAQQNVALFIANLDSNSLENDVNSIIKDIEVYIDSLTGTRSRADALLAKNFAAMRLFYLTTTNKTTVATSFLYDLVPYRYCTYNDSVALHISAVKNGEIYNLAKQTEKRVARTALMNCLLPSLTAMREFKDTDIRYISLSIYYGCKDTRDGADGPITPYCLTLVAPMADILQYADGMITARGLIAGATLYLSSTDNSGSLSKTNIKVDDVREETK